MCLTWLPLFQELLYAAYLPNSLTCRHCTLKLILSTLTRREGHPDVSSCLILQAAQDAISSSVNALKTDLNASRVFKGLGGGGGLYTLRCIVCYFGHHYQVRDLVCSCREDYRKYFVDLNGCRGAGMLRHCCGANNTCICTNAHGRS
jgi:hypothetical protein